MTSTQSTKAYRASGMLRRILRLEASPAFQTQWDVRWMDLEPRPKVPIARNEHWVIDVLDDKKPKVSARWRRTTDPNDHGTFPPGCEHNIQYYHFGFNPDENVIYEDEVDPNNGAPGANPARRAERHANPKPEEPAPRQS